MPKTLQDKDRKEVHPSRNQCWRCSRVLAAELLREASVPGDLELLIPRLCLVWKSHVQYPHGLLATLNNLYLSAQQGSCGSRSKSSLSSVIPADFDAVWSRPTGPVWLPFSHILTQLLQLGRTTSSFTWGIHHVESNLIQPLESLFHPSWLQRIEQDPPCLAKLSETCSAPCFSQRINLALLKVTLLVPCLILAW